MALAHVVYFPEPRCTGHPLGRKNLPVPFRDGRVSVFDFLDCYVRPLVERKNLPVGPWEEETPVFDPLDCYVTFKKLRWGGEWVYLAGFDWARECRVPSPNIISTTHTPS